MSPMPNVNGLVFHSEKDIFYREFLINLISNHLRECFKQANRAIEFMRVETPCLVSGDIVQDHLKADFPLWTAKDGNHEDAERFWLRPESTKGTYSMFDILWPQESELKRRLPMCLWQSGLSFRVEQDKTFAHMRFKQFYQLEFQLAYAEGTKFDYHQFAVSNIMQLLIQHFPWLVVRHEPLFGDELPFYSDATTDVYLLDATKHAQSHQEWEVVAISKRKDFKYPVLEMSFGLDRLTRLIQMAH